MVNRILSALVLLVGGYLVVQPVYPAVVLWFQNSFNADGGYVYQSHLEGGAGVGVPEGNRLVIPSIHVDGKLVEGEDPIALDQGIWRRPGTSTPDQGGNTVLAAHRYLYRSGPNTFYNLDKVELGDELAVYWDDTEYDYRVTEIKEVDPDATEVEGMTSTSVLTLYTCTPLWTASRRLVVVAELAGEYPLSQTNE